MKNVRKDLQLFLDLARQPRPERPEDMSLRILVPAFMISELKRAFEIGFLLFLPFLIIDLVVASVLMSMGMMMLPPVVVSLPFKADLLRARRRLEPGRRQPGAELRDVTGLPSRDAWGHPMAAKLPGRGARRRHARWRIKSHENRDLPLRISSIEFRPNELALPH